MASGIIQYFLMIRKASCFWQSLNGSFVPCTADTAKTFKNYNLSRAKGQYFRKPAQ